MRGDVMKNFRSFTSYFFGQGTEVEFRNFTPAHFLPILFGVFVVFLIYRFRDKLASLKNEMALRNGFALAMLISEMSYYWRLATMPELGGNPLDHLPITICGWVIVFGALMLSSKSQTLFDICYFWVFSGTVFALITPTVITYTGPTRFRYYQFWCEHLFGYFAVFYMIFVHKFRPKIISVIKSFSCLTVLGVIAIFTNKILGPGANYLFVAELEETASLLDILPKNYGLRLCLMATAVTVLFALSYLPWFIKDKKNNQPLFK